MTTSKPFQPFALTAADASLPMIYAGSIAAFHLEVPETGIAILQKAIAEVFQHIPFLSGVLVPSPQTAGVVEVHPAPTGPSTSQTTTETSFVTVKRLPNLRLPLPTRPVSGAFPCSDFEQYDRNRSLVLAPMHVTAYRSHHPVLAFQINVLADGIILTAFSNHMVIDGAGVGTIWKMLAACCRAPVGPCSPLYPDLADSMDREITTRKYLSTIGESPFLDRGNSSYSNTTAQVEGEVDTDHITVTATTTSKSTENPFGIHDTSLHDCTFHLSGERVQCLHQTARQLWLSENEHATRSVSEDDIVTAVLYLALSRVRSAPRPSEDSANTTPCTFLRVVDVRRRLRPPVPERYIGNCFIMVEMEQRQLMPATAQPRDQGDSALDSSIHFEQLISPLACKLRTRLNEVDDAYVRDHLAQQATGANAPSPEIVAVIVTSLRRLQIYELDFGSVLGGAVDFQQLPYMNPEGVCTIFPRRVGSDAWEVGVTLCKGDMERLKGDDMLRWLAEGEECSLLNFFEPVQV
ncbi:transferase family-domain-containing protein [Aspergillus undulatus]|uniref:transferase family-domain-containing protein n=1 Tax=Aspergillus undulatus TaxID=1810928 RepID=UPI003CCE192D